MAKKAIKKKGKKVAPKKTTKKKVVKKKAAPKKKEPKNESETKEIKLNPKQKKFCELYISKEFFGNGVSAYMEAYNIKPSVKGAYAAARVSAHHLLTNPNILAQINANLDFQGMNDGFVDKQLLLLITQNSDFGSKISAIKEYNKLKQRITDKAEVEVTGDGISIENWINSQNAKGK